MSDEEILHKYVDLDKSCLIDSEKKLVMDMLYKYKDASSLRDKIGTCLNIEVEIDATDNSPFFIRFYHVKEADKNILDKEMKRLCYLRIFKEGFQLILVQLCELVGRLPRIRVLTYFRHLNIRIAKSNLAYPL